LRPLSSANFSRTCPLPGLGSVDGDVRNNNITNFEEPAMFGFIKNLFGISTKTPARRSPAKSLNARLGVERLENREVMSVTPHGGVILPHVELQSVYLGSEWSQNSTYHNQTGQLERFGGTLVNSSYMDMLTQAGYQVGRGSASQGLILNYNYNFNYYLTDSTIRSELQTSIRAGQLQQPDANRLSVIYVEPNVAIMNDHDHNSTSQKDFTGYHSAFAGMDRFGHSIDIHYAVVA